MVSLKQKALDVPMRLHSILSKRRLHRQRQRLRALQKQDDWCLIVLDACRFDILEQEFESYFRGTVVPIWSSGSNTFDYLRTNWTGVYNIPYITAAAPVTPHRIDFDSPEASSDGLHFRGKDLFEMYQGYQPADHLTNIHAVWQEQWDEELGVCPPEAVTKHALEISGSVSSIVVHYFQPHAPFIGEKSYLPSRNGFEGLQGGAVAGDVWDKVREGSLSNDELKLLYQSNLERALIATSELIRMTDFDRYVIIGDHGEALGEYGRYAHSLNWHPYVRTIPWAEVEAVKSGVPHMEEVGFNTTAIDSETTVGERLSQLGYLS